MINRIMKFLSSMKLMSILLLIFAFSIGYATFIENDFGRSSAKALVYNQWWFELILILLVYNLLNNIIKYRLFSFNKLATLTFHLAFIVILLGAGVTRYISFEGMMHIREGQSTNKFISDDTFLQIHINDGQHQLNYDKKLFISGITNNQFSITPNFKSHDIRISYVNFLPNVKDSVFENLDDGSTILHIVVPGENGMQSEYLRHGEKRVIKGELFTFNNFSNDAINITLDSNNILCESPYNVVAMSMESRETNNFQKDTQFTLKRRTLNTTNSLNFVLKNVLYNAKLRNISASNVMKDGAKDALVVKVLVNGIEESITLFGGKGFTGNDQVFRINDLNFKLVYGSKYYRVPFMVKLRDFQLDRYPGSMSPSSYAAEVSILDNNIEKPYRIFMNNVLQYRGYRLFQSSYDKDEKGTILSVNHDWWGTLISYIGYALMGLGMILVLLSRKTRFHVLTQKLRKLNKRSFMFVFTFLLSTFLYGGEVINQKHIDNFDRLVIQDNGGRLKPVNTLCSEFLRKIYGKTTYNNLSASQVILGMMNNPVAWSKESIIKVTNLELRELLGNPDIKSRNIRVSFNDFFLEGNYILNELVTDAYSTLPGKRSEYEKDIIKIDERVNVCFTVFSGGIFRFFPLPNDSTNSWLPSSQSTRFSGVDSLFVSNIMPMYFSAISKALDNNNWSKADSIISYISKFQIRYGTEIIPSKYKIDLEVMYNNIQLFSRLFMYFFLVGSILLSLLIINLFNKSQLLYYLIQIFKWLVIIGFLAHTSGLIARWIISGHAPWSNGYESMIYIVWATLFAGLFFSKRSLLTLAATSIVASLLLMVAHLNWLDPEITNLVPVLKSYWLMIHVAIIVASYGFLALGALLALIALWLIIFTRDSNKLKLKDTLSEITLINEKSLQIGLFMLAIGTFLGGVWANESWGRYWGWDPKETWALVSVLIYAFVLHMRFIPVLKGKLVFNIVSMFAIWTIFMTYFGVNYYLSGLHSYAAGDPMPIPVFIYYLLALMFVTAFLARFNYRKHY